MKTRTYAAAGVDIDASERATAALVAQLGSAARREGDGAPITLANGFAGLVRLGDGALAVATDGVGTKLLLAEQLDSLHTVGIDCVAMNVNDLLCVGAEPLSFVDYIALDVPDEALMARLGEGLAEGCRQAHCTLSGGETAIVPELVHGFDIAGTAVGYAAPGRLLDGTRVAVGDALVGLASSGPHSNGYTLLRRICADAGADLAAPLGDTTLGAALVAPTRIYVRAFAALREAVTVHGAAHLTGGGLDNIARMAPGLRYLIDAPLTVPPVFDWLQQHGDIAPAEMYRTFNMGMGFIVAVAAEDAHRAVAALRAAGERAAVVGRVTAGEGVAHAAL